MTDRLKSFLEAATQDRAYFEKLKTAKTLEEVIALAKEKGFALSAEDLRPDENRQLSEDELVTVAGGAVCACVAGGGGDAGRVDDLCICALAGEGEYWAQEERQQDIRCVCVVVGGGSSYEQ